MAKLDKLIQELCPNGVEYKEIRSMTSILRGKRLTKNQLFPEERFPVYHGGLEPLGFYNEKNRNADTVMVINVGASAGTVGYSPVDFWSSDGCFCIEHSNQFINRYMYYAILCQESYLKSRVRVAGIPTLDNAVVERLKVPIPPIEVQEEIVRILDNFTELAEELTAELNARIKQYSEFSYRLLFSNSNVEKVMIRDICTLIKGKTPIQKATPGDYPMVVTTIERKTCNTYQFETEAVCIPLISSRGHGVASLNHVYYQDGKFALGNILCAMIPKDTNYVCAKYLYYYFECTKDYTLVPLMKGGANVAMHMSDIEKVKVPIPPLGIQHDIVSKLERMEEYHKTLLPAEIEARKKQYEYYRDKLLTFKEKVAS